MSIPRFYLGTHEPAWLPRTDVPLFVSARRLRRRLALPRAAGQWALDSGGFTELSLYGAWQTTPEQYVAEVRCWRDEVGGMEWAAPQDWMCEEVIIKGGKLGSRTVPGTGLSVREHQRLTLVNYQELRRLADDLPWIPVLQGWDLADYVRHMDDYARAGLDLARLPLVGLGSVCRRQGTSEAARIVKTLRSYGVKLHLFGFKTRGLVKCAHWAASADSLAWSYQARKRPALEGCTHKTCANCMPYAMAWRAELMARLEAVAAKPSERLLWG